MPKRQNEDSGAESSKRSRVAKESEEEDDDVLDMSQNPDFISKTKVC